jgi:putative flippase GtrA
VSGSELITQTQTPPARPRPHVARVEGERAARYAVVGVVNVAIDFALYALLVTVGVWYPIAKAVSLTVATANGYTWNRLWTFRAGPHQYPMLARYVAVQAICYVGNVALLAVLIELLDRSEVVAQVIALPLIAGLSFLLQRLWTFRGLSR